MTPDQIKIINLEADVRRLTKLLESFEGGDLFDRLVWLIEHRHASVRFMVRRIGDDITWTDEISARELREKLIDHLKSWTPAIQRGPIIIKNPVKPWSPCSGDFCDHPSHRKESNNE